MEFLLAVVLSKKLNRKIMRQKHPRDTTFILVFISVVDIPLKNTRHSIQFLMTRSSPVD